MWNARGTIDNRKNTGVLKIKCKNTGTPLIISLNVIIDNYNYTCERLSLKETTSKQEAHIIIFSLIYINWAF